MKAEQIEVYKAALLEAKSSFEKASNAVKQAERDCRLLRAEMSRLRRTITALAAQVSEEPWSDPMGITEACMEVMGSTRFALSTQEVVTNLEEMGFDVASQKNVAASVHAVLTRLADREKITKVSGDDGKSAVLWKGPKYEEITDDDIPF